MGWTPPPLTASIKIRRFIDQNNISILNVAGPRASDKPEAYEYARMVILNVIQ
jgi:hypothetical protein